MSLIQNERTKLLALAFNTAATSAFTVGVLAPVATALYDFGISRQSPKAVIENRRGKGALRGFWCS